MIIDDLKKANIEALKNKDKEARSVLNVVLSKYQLLLVEARSKGKELEDADVVSIIQKVLKELQDEKECYVKGNKLDRVEAITHQEDTIKQYLPKQLTDEELVAEVKKVIEKLNATSMKDMGPVMKEAKATIGAQADGKRINEVVKSLLA